MSRWEYGILGHTRTPGGGRHTAPHGEGAGRRLASIWHQVAQNVIGVLELLKATRGARA